MTPTATILATMKKDQSYTGAHLSTLLRMHIDIVTVSLKLLERGGKIRGVCGVYTIESTKNADGKY